MIMFSNFLDLKIALFLVSNLSLVKLPGLILCFTVLLEFAAILSLLINGQIDSLKSFMSWNGFADKLRNFLITKLKGKHFVNSIQLTLI